MPSVPQITVLEPPAKGELWELNYRDFTIDSLASLPKRCYLFLDVKNYPPADGRREKLLAHFDVPEFVANRTCFELNGYFGNKASYDDPKTKAITSYDDPIQTKAITSYTTWFRCIVKMVKKVEGPHENAQEYVTDKGYKWFEMSFFSRWTPDASQILCVDVPPDFPDELKNLLDKQAWPLEFRDPLAMHSSLVDQMNVYYDISVWRVRDPVRSLEKARMRVGAIFGPIHETSRHAIHTTEVLGAAIDTIQELQRRRVGVYQRLSDSLGETYREQAKDYAEFQISVLKNLKLRSSSNQERLTNEINLAFNNLARQDNSVMKAIALLTMVFLPATFISAIFSTSFFSNTDEREWVVSDKFWVYWATIIPATVLCVALWYTWLTYSDAIVGFPNACVKFVQTSWKGREKPLPSKAEQA